MTTLKELAVMAGVQIIDCDPAFWGGPFGWMLKSNAKFKGAQSEEDCYRSWANETFGKPVAAAIMKVLEESAGAKSPEVRRFSDEMPTCRWFAFVDPEQPSRWAIGWKDWYHIREEGGSSYRHNDPRLTWWYPLPDVPAQEMGQGVQTTTELTSAPSVDPTGRYSDKCSKCGKEHDFPIPRFTVGQRVRLVKDSGFHHLDKLGQETLIVSVATFMVCPCDPVEYETGFGFGNILEDRLEPATGPEPPKLAPTSVRCFRRLQTEPCTTRRGVWLMTGGTGCRGVFYHGDREEAQAPRFSVEELVSGDLPFEVQEITPEQALKELSSWPEAQAQAFHICERHRTDKVE